MVELRAARTQPDFDVAQTFAIGEQRESQTEKRMLPVLFVTPHRRVGTVEQNEFVVRNQQSDGRALLYLQR